MIRKELIGLAGNVRREGTVETHSLLLMKSRMSCSSFSSIILSL